MRSQRARRCQARSRSSRTDAPLPGRRDACCGCGVRGDEIERALSRLRMFRKQTGKDDAGGARTMATTAAIAEGGWSALRTEGRSPQDLQFERVARHPISEALLPDIARNGCCAQHLLRDSVPDLGSTLPDLERSSGCTQHDPLIPASESRRRTSLLSSWIERRAAAGEAFGDFLGPRGRRTRCGGVGVRSSSIGLTNGSGASVSMASRWSRALRTRMSVSTVERPASKCRNALSETPADAAAVRWSMFLHRRKRRIRAPNSA